MKAFTITTPGKNFALKERNVPQPEPAPDEILVKTQAAALNPVDAKLLSSGVSSWHYPHTPGLDACGVVEKLGQNVSNIAVGDRIMVHSDLNRPGTFAEYFCIPAHGVSIVPDTISSIVAGSLPCAALTAYQSTVRKMNVYRGQTLLVEAGAGGVGGFAIQIAKAGGGVTVITTASEENHEYVTSLGADLAIDYKRKDVAEEILAFTDGKKLDAIHDAIGKNSQRNLELLKNGGHYASLLGVPDTTGTDVFNLAPTFHMIALGSAWGSGSYESQKDLAAMGDELLKLIETGHVKPLPITEVAPNAQALTEALHLQLSGKVVGKQVLVF